ncbi:MAG: hypothetical protein QXU54_00235 [Candidatus Micrarchaeia archaeon]
METFQKLFIIALLLSGTAIAATRLGDVLSATEQQMQGTIPLISAILIAVGAIIAVAAYAATKFISFSEQNEKLIMGIALAVTAIFILFGAIGLVLAFMSGWLSNLF